MMKYARRASGRHLLATSLLTLGISGISRADCDAGVNRLESSEGRVVVEYTAGNQVRWQTLQRGDCVPTGVRIHVQGGRTVFRLANETLLRASGPTQLRIEPAQEKTWIQLYQGLLHFFTRTPHAFDVQTEYVNAGVKGTEFTISASEEHRESQIAVLEGEVLASNSHGEEKAGNDRIAIAKSGEAPRLVDIPPRRNAVQWTLYYPPLPAPDQPRYGTAIAALQRGNPIDAMQALDKIAVEARDADYYLLRAAVELYRGNIDPAQAAIANVRQPNASAQALRAMIALTNDDNDEAAKQVAQAAQQAPGDPAVLIAQSYVAQAQFDLAAALAFALSAARQRDNDALIHARVAELALINGETALAQEAAAKAIAIQPEHPRALTVDGFVQLQRYRFDDAERAFEKAVRSNASDPLPHLGLGLIAIRHNRVAAGREQLALAVALDPGQSLLRSYLGKAYQEEERPRLAQDQYTLAKTFDPADPTPWLYSALQARAQNRPFDALDDLNRSIELNDNRAVYRSRLQLDGDEAARTASQAEIYRKLGFDEAAQRIAARAVAAAPGEYGGHRQLAESYADNPRYDSARASEVLQAQLLQPLSATPLLPILGETNLQAIEGAGPAALGYREYNTMFVREKPWISMSGLGGGKRMWADEVALSGVTGRVAYALSQYHYESIGHRENNDLRHDVVTGYMKFQATEDWSFLLSLKQREEDRGNIASSVIEDSENRFEQFESRTSSAVLGSHLSPTAGIDLLATFTYAESDPAAFSITPSGPFAIAFDSTNETRLANAEFQAQIANRWGHVVTGADWSETSFDRSRQLTFFLAGPPPVLFTRFPATLTEGVERFESQYFYWTVFPVKDLEITAGIAHSTFGSDNYDDEISGWYPKLGLTHSLLPGLNLRAGYFQTIKPPEGDDQTLEPTVVAGFNQLADEIAGIESEEFALGLDFDSGHYQLGIETALKKSEIPITGIATRFFDAEQRQTQAYWHWSTKPWAVSLSYQYEKAEYVDLAPAAQPTPLTTQRIPLKIKWHSGNLTLSAVATYMDQDGKFLDVPETVDERFTVVDMSVAYSLNQYAELELRCNNLFDKSFRYQDTNIYDPSPRLPPYIPERLFLVSLKIAY